MELVRLDKFLSLTRQLSRADAKRVLRSGAVAVNGVVCKNADTKVNTQTDTVLLNGKQIIYEKFVYIMMNKPAGIVSASRDPRERTVVDLVPEDMRRKGLFPAGRLDKDTTGFVLLTDDGDFAHRILAPGKHVPKTYLVTLERNVTDAEVKALAEGPVLDEEKLLPVSVSIVDAQKNMYHVVLMEGRYHQIKRMFAAQGNPVHALHRFKMGGLLLDETLSPGACRLLTADEVAQIRE